MLTQRAVGVDGDRCADQGQHRNVVGGVGVCSAAREVKALSICELLDCLGLGFSVQRAADEVAGVDAMYLFADGSQSAGQSEVFGDQFCEFDGCGGDQPDTLARVDVSLSQRDCAWPETVDHVLVEDLAGQRDQLGLVAALDQGKCLFSDVLHVIGRFFAHDDEPGLLPHEVSDLAFGQVLVLGQSARPVEHGCAVNECVVDVEERGRMRIGILRGGVGNLGAFPVVSKRHLNQASAHIVWETASVVANLADLVSVAAQERPRHPAVVTDARVTTWSEVEWQVRAVASGLIARGLQPGSRVAIVQRNTLEFVTSYFGILRAGMVAVPLNTGYTAAEVGLMLGDVDVSVVLADPEAQVVLDDVDAEVIYTGTEDWRRFTVGSSPLPTDPTDPEALAVLLFTSGTSGRPKAAMLTHRALSANLDQLAALDDPPGLLAEDVVLCVLPLFHIYALNATLGLVARQQSTIVLLDRFDAASALAAVKKHKVTNIAGAPPMYVAWSIQDGLSEALADVRLLVSGAAALPRNVMEQYETLVGKPIWEGYGMTECSPVITASLRAGRPKAGFVGQALEGIEVELRDQDGDVVKDGDPGEIFVRGANVFSGYWPDGSGGADDEGWFATGDVAYADADGDLRLVDRRKDLIIVSGFNVYPREVEDALMRLDGVLEVAVMGVTHPYTGEAVKAFVVAAPDSGLTNEDVLTFARTRLARFKCPTIVEIVGDLPHSVTGKVSKGRLRESQGAVSL